MDFICSQPDRPTVWWVVCGNVLFVRLNRDCPHLRSLTSFAFASALRCHAYPNPFLSSLNCPDLTNVLPRDQERCWSLGSTLVRRSEEHTSELQSHLNLVCRLLL